MRFFWIFHWARRNKSFVANTGALTFTMSGISKISGLPQMKFAWLAVSGPGELEKGSAGPAGDDRRHLSLHERTHSAGCARFAAAARRSFSSSSWPACAGILANSIRSSPERSMPAGWRLKEAGTPFCAFRQRVRMKSLTIELLEKHDVYLHPGHFYDFPGDGYLVVSLITPEQEFARRRATDFLVSRSVSLFLNIPSEAREPYCSQNLWTTSELHRLRTPSVQELHRGYTQGSHKR